MAALRAAVFPLFAKNRRGGHFLPPPPSSARVNKTSRSTNAKLMKKYGLPHNNMVIWFTSFLKPFHLSIYPTHES